MKISLRCMAVFYAILEWFLLQMVPNHSETYTIPDREVVTPGGIKRRMANRENTPTIGAHTKVTKAHAGILFAIKMMILCGVVAVPQDFACPQNTTKQKEPVRRADINSGKKMFVEYCASCHGIDGKGNGPAAAALKPAPTDLTTLAKANEGKYPAGFVSAMLKFGRNPVAHGSSEMPVWGSRFKMIDPNHDPSGQQHVDDIVAYIGSLQQK